MLNKKLIELLVCPQCQQHLEYQAVPEQLNCTSCALAFPITDDIPVMLLEAAKPISSQDD